MVKENEYLFHQKNVDGMMHSLMSPQWDIVLQLFSFFGHYGVPVFLFLSGYGLVLKYECNPIADKGESIWQFMKNHFMKLFPMMLLGFVCFAMVDRITPGHHHWTWTDILAQLTMTINLLPHPDHIIWPGPYWFFGLMMQLYLVYRVMLYRRPSNMAVALVIFCWLCQAFCFSSPVGETLNRIRYNCIGGMLPFVMGILLARSERQFEADGMRLTVALLAGVTLCVALSLNFHTWLWVPAVIVVVNITFVKLMPRSVISVLNWLGALSSAIFVCHPITRKIFIPISRGGDIVDGLLLYIVATLMLAMLFRMVIARLRQQ